MDEKQDKPPSRTPLQKPVTPWVAASILTSLVIVIFLAVRLPNGPEKLGTLLVLFALMFAKAYRCAQVAGRTPQHP
jgi:hypothetical protein